MSDDFDGIWKQIVKFFFKFSNFNFALEILENIENDHSWKSFFRARILHAQGQFQQSYESLRGLLKSGEGPLAEEALLLSAKNLYFLLKNFEAEENLLMYIKSKKNKISSGNMVFLGLIFMQRKNFSSSEDIFLKVIKKVQRSALIWYLMGICLIKNKKWVRAEEAFIKCREIDPQFSDSILGLFRVRINHILRKRGSSPLVQDTTGLFLLKRFFSSMEKYEVINLRLLEDVSKKLEASNLNELALKCLFQITRDFGKYKGQVMNQLVNIFQIEKAILSGCKI